MCSCFFSCLPFLGFGSDDDSLSISPLLDSASVNKKIPSLSRKLLVSEEKLRTELNKGVKDLSSYVRRKEEKYGEVLELARKDCEQIFANYDYEKGELRAKDCGHLPNGLTIGLLMKIIRHATLLLTNQQDEEQKGVQVYMKNYPDWHLLATRENGVLQIVKWSGRPQVSDQHKNFLGEGAFAFVQKVEDIANSCFAAFKIAVPTKEEYGVYIWNEFCKLNEIHEGGVKEGIQLAPYAYFKIIGENAGERIVAHIQKLYNYGCMDGPLLMYRIDLSGRVGLSMIRQAFIGLKNLHTETLKYGLIIHGDIKPPNIFLENIPGKSLKLYLADYGGAQNTKYELTLENITEPLQKNFTYGYFSRKECVEQFKVIKNKDLDTFHFLEQMRDIYALASSLWTSLVGCEPYRLYKKNGEIFPIFNGVVQGKDRFFSKYGEDVTNIMIKALDEDPYKRPTIDDILAIVDKILW